MIDSQVKEFITELEGYYSCKIFQYENKLKAWLTSLKPKDHGIAGQSFDKLKAVPKRSNRRKCPSVYEFDGAYNSILASKKAEMSVDLNASSCCTRGKRSGISAGRYPSRMRPINLSTGLCSGDEVVNYQDYRTYSVPCTCAAGIKINESLNDQKYKIHHLTLYFQNTYVSMGEAQEKINEIQEALL